jgi:flagellin-specific chaperone FliS
LRAEGHLEARQFAQATAALLGAQRILARLIAQLNYFGQPALAGQMAAVYGFIYKSLVIAQLRRDRSKVADAIRVLRVERETWRLVCEKLGAGEGKAATPGAPTGPHFSRLAQTAGAEQPHTPISFEA